MTSYKVDIFLSDLSSKIKQYVIKFASDLRQVGGFLRVLRFSSTKKTDSHDIAEILLKVALTTTTKLQDLLSFFSIIKGKFVSLVTLVYEIFSAK